MYKEYIIPNNEKGRHLLKKIEDTNKTVIISRRYNVFKVKIKVKEGDKWINKIKDKSKD